MSGQLALAYGRATTGRPAGVARRITPQTAAAFGGS